MPSEGASTPSLTLRVFGSQNSPRSEAPIADLPRWVGGASVPAAEALKAGPDMEVLWRPRIQLTDGAERFAATGDYETCLVNDLRQPDVRQGGVRPTDKKPQTIEVDFIVINRRTGEATAYECKRGGTCDWGKRQKIVENLVLVKLVLADYLRQKGHEIRSADVRLIAYYGSWSLKPIQTLTRETIDAHFGVAVTPVVAMAAEMVRREMTGNLMPFVASLLECLAAQSAGPGMADTRLELVRLLSQMLESLRAADE